MFSFAVKHLSDTPGTGFTASRAMGDPGLSGPGMKLVLRKYGIRTSYTVDEANGSEPYEVEAVFPSGTYSALDYTPVKSGYRFAGWCSAQDDPPYDAEVEYLEATGSQYINTGVNSPESGWFRVSAEVDPNSNTQIPVGVTGDATSGTSQQKRWYAVMDGKAQTGYYDCGTAKARVTYSGSLLMDTGKQPFEIVINSAKRVYLFATNPLPSSGNRFHGKIFAAQLWDQDGSLLLDLHPVRVGATGYMHNRVSNSLLGASGGAFIVGPDMLEADVDVSGRVPVDPPGVVASWQPPSDITFDATTNGGSMPSGWVSPYYYGGRPYGILPQPLKTGSVFIGWFIGTSTAVVSESSLAVHGSATLTAKYAVPTYDTSFEVTTTSSYRKTGIYAANSRNTANPTIVDWGDGTTDFVYGNISKLAHTYSSNGTFTVQVNNNISSFALSGNDSTWYGTTSQNRYTVKKLTAIGSNVTSIPTYAFNYCSAMTDAVLPSGVSSVPNYCFNYCQALKGISIPSNYTSIGQYAFQYCNSSSFTSVTIPAAITSIGNYAFSNCRYLNNITFESATATLTLGTYCFYYCFYQAAAVGTIDMSPRKITTIPANCFHHCDYLKGVVWPQGTTSVGQQAFRYCFRYASSTGTVAVPEGVTAISSTYAFADCAYLTAVTLPSTITNLNNHTFRSCPRIATITCNCSTAPTVSASTFGDSSSTYTGRNSYSAGTNRLYVPAGATGYTSSYWNSVLLDSTKCGFTLEEMQ